MRKSTFSLCQLSWLLLKNSPRRNRTPSAKKARTSPSSKSEDNTRESKEGKVSSSSQPKSLASKLAQIARSEPSRDARQADSDEDFHKERKGLLDTLRVYSLFFLNAIIIYLGALISGNGTNINGIHINRTCM
jgi:hypothetical protein